MYNKLSSTAIDAFRSTVRMVEERCGLSPDDPSLLEMKRILLNRIAELEAVKVTSEQDEQRSTDFAAEVDMIADAPGSQKSGQ